MSTSIKFNGKEVQNPIIRILVVILAIVCVVILIAALGLGAVFIILGLISLTFVLTVPLHFILRLCGRRGFYVRECNSHTWTITGAFQHR